VSWFVKATEGGVYDAPAVHLWTDPYTTETVPGGSIVVTFSEGKPASITLTYGDQVEPTECLEEPPTCSMTKMYYQFTLTNGSETCYQVSWDTKDEIKRPNEFWIPNVTRQLCTCGWVAENAPYDGWVYKDCHGNYWYHGQRWDFFDKSLLTPHWDGQCAMGGC